MTQADKKKVLIIDDEKATLTMFNLFLTSYGYTVLVAQDGHSGLCLAREHRPEIVFTDLKMPGMDGFEVLKQLKKKMPVIEVIVITGHGDMDMVVQALNLGAMDFINKPIDRKSLECSLERAERRLDPEKLSKPDMEFRKVGRATVISINNCLAKEHRKRLDFSLENAQEVGSTVLIVSFDINATINGTTISELVRFLTQARKERFRTAIIGLSDNFKSIFETVGVNRFADFYEDIEEAMAVSP